MLTDLLFRLRALVSRRAVEREIDAELQLHIDRQVEAYERAGLDHAEALRRARLEFGGLDQIKEEYRDALGVRLADTVRRDASLAVRSLRSTPIVTAAAVLSLALGIGANTTIFSLVNGLLLRALPVADPQRLVLVSDTPDHVRAWSYPLWQQIQQRPELFADAAAWSLTRFNLTSGGGETRFVDGLWVSGSFFRTLGVAAVAGRTLAVEDDRRGGTTGPVAVVSYGFWQRHFGGAADVVGRVLRLDDASFTIVGVTPPDFFGAEVGRAFDVAVPLAAEPLSRGRDTYLDSVSTSFLTIVARLRTDQSLDAAVNGLRAAQPAIRDATSGELSAFGGAAIDRYLTSPFTLVPGATGFEGASGFRERYQRPLWTMLAIVALVLVIACVNVANLVLARAHARRHEFSLRMALGASRWDLVRQLFAESVLLAIAGAVGGWWLASWGGPFLVNQLSTSVNNVFLDLSVDFRIVAFTAAIAALTTVVFGTGPAIRASNAAPIDALKDQGRGAAAPAHGRLAGGFVVAQIALSVVLLVSAALLVRSFTGLAARPLGFQADRVTIVTLDARRSALTPEARLPGFERARDAVRALPDVDDAALSLVTPFTSGFTPPVKMSGSNVAVQGRLFGNLITAGWFATFGTPIRAGRDFTERDRHGAPRVAIVNETFARTFFPGGTPLGQRLFLYPDTSRAMPPIEIVGVAADAVYSSMRAPVPATWYVPLAQFDVPEFAIPSLRMSVRARTGAAPSSKAVAAAIGAVQSDLALTFRPLADHVHAALTQERLIARLSGYFSVLALLLAAVGLYGVTSYDVTRRRVEIGIRLALGAAPSVLISWLLGRLSRLVGLGIAAGLAISFWATTLLAGLIYGLHPRDPAAPITAALVLTAIAAFAAWLPARRATRIDPIAVLRES